MTRAKQQSRNSRREQRGKDAALSVRSAATPVATNDDVQHRDITTRSVSVRADSFNEQTRTFEATLTTENPVTVFDWRQWREIDEVLLADGGRWPERMPMLDCHNRFTTDDVLGSMIVGERKGGDTIVRATFANGDERADKAMLKVRDKHITDVSLGYRVAKFTDIPAGQSGVVNGRTFSAGPDRPLRVTTEWEAVEGSLVPIGADRAAKIRKESSPPAARKEMPAMNETLRKYLESIGLRADASVADAWAFMSTITTEQQRHATGLMSPTAEGQQPTPATSAPTQRQAAAPAASGAAAPPASAVDAASVRKDERDRIAAIRALAKDNTPAEVITRAIDSGLTIEQAGYAILQAERAAFAGSVGDNSPNINENNHTTQEREAVLTSYLALRAGLRHDRLPTPRGLSPEQKKSHRERMANMADELGNVSLADICRGVLESQGVRVGMGTGALLSAMRDQVRAGASTGGLSNVFTTSMNAIMLQGYAEAGDTTQQFTNQVEVANFLTQDRILPDNGTGLRKLGRSGTAKDIGYSDSKESYRIARYAGKITADEQDVIDDNLGWLQSRSRNVGQLAGEIRPRLVYALLLDNAALGADSIALFNASHSNTATNALSAANLATGIAAMAKQTMNNRVLNLMPRFLIAPQDLWNTAMEILQSPTIVIAGSTDSTRGTKNVIADMNITPVIDGRLGVAGVTDPSDETAVAGSATNWFLAADPVVGNTIEVGVLRGTGGRPQIRNYVLTQGQWGMGWDVAMDIGAKVLDYRGLYRGNT